MDPLDTVCVICKLGGKGGAERIIKLRSDGKKTLIKFSSLHGDHALADYLESDTLVAYVHKSCQLNFTRERDVLHTGSLKGEVSSKNLRSTADKFDWKQCCFLCCHPIMRSEPSREVRTMAIHQSMLQACENRQDEWGFQVLGRLQTCGDLHAAEARYHKKCHMYFTSHKSYPSPFPCDVSVGRPVGSTMMELFESVCDWMENGDSELYTVEQLHDKMIEMAFGADNVY